MIVSENEMRIFNMQNQVATRVTSPCVGGVFLLPFYIERRNQHVVKDRDNQS